MDNMEMKENFENFLEGLDEQNYYMIEEEIDIDIQNKYFKLSRTEGKLITKEKVMAEVPMLDDAEVNIDEKKRILAQLANLRDVESFRILEKQCRKFDDDELNVWSVLAYNEARMTLNGALKNQQQVFISTGLGGKEGKFRYFVVFFPSLENETFTEFHRNFVKKELEFTLGQNKGEVERLIEENEDYISFKILIPIKANVPKLFELVLNNCNQLAPFVNDKFIFTNVGEMNNIEINEFLDESDEAEGNEIIEDIVSMN